MLRLEINHCLARTLAYYKLKHKKISAVNLKSNVDFQLKALKKSAASCEQILPVPKVLNISRTRCSNRQHPRLLDINRESADMMLYPSLVCNNSSLGPSDAYMRQYHITTLYVSGFQVELGYQAMLGTLGYLRMMGLETTFLQNISNQHYTPGFKLRWNSLRYGRVMHWIYSSKFHKDKEAFWQNTFIQTTNTS